MPLSRDELEPSYRGNPVPVNYQSNAPLPNGGVPKKQRSNLRDMMVSCLAVIAVDRRLFEGCCGEMPRGSRRP